MKKYMVLLIAAVVTVAGCATVQSIIKSTFPYTASLIVPASSGTNSTLSATSSASSFDQIFGNQSGTDYIREVRVTSAKIDATNPSSQNLGVFKSVKLYVANGSGEVLAASRNDVSENVGPSLTLDINNSRFIDEYIKGNNVRIRMEYVLRSGLTTDISVRAAVNFSSSPNPQK